MPSSTYQTPNSILRNTFGWPVLLVVLVVLWAVMGLWLWSTRPAHRPTDDEFARAAAKLALQRLSGVPHARILSVTGNANSRRACGWARVGPPEGEVLFDVQDDPHTKKPRVEFFETRSGTISQQVVGLFYRQLALESCAIFEAVPYRSKWAEADLAANAELARLWDRHDPQQWAVVSPYASNVFVGVRRRVGGGLFLTPAFPSADAARTWISREGDKLTDASDARGRAAMERLDDCYDRAKGSGSQRTCHAVGLDEVVQLQPSS